MNARETPTWSLGQLQMRHIQLRIRWVCCRIASVLVKVSVLVEQSYLNIVHCTKAPSTSNAIRFSDDNLVGERRTGIGGAHEYPGGFTSGCIGMPRDRQFNLIGEVNEILNRLLNSVHAKALCCKIRIRITLSKEAVLEHDRSSIRLLR